MCKRSGFTLVELLVVIAIIAVLLTLVTPVLNQAREQAKRVVCASHLHDMGQGTIMYAVEYEDRIPPTNGSSRIWFSQNTATYYLYWQWPQHEATGGAGPDGPAWLFKADILDDPATDIMFCPSAKRLMGTDVGPYEWNSRGDPTHWNYVGPGSIYGWYLRPVDEQIGWINMRVTLGWRNMAELGVTKTANAHSMAYLSDYWMAEGGFYTSHIADMPHVSSNLNEAFVNVWCFDGSVETKIWDRDIYFNPQGYMWTHLTWAKLFEGASWN